MSTDRDLITKEDHELNYVLCKWGFQQIESNRELLKKELDEHKQSEFTRSREGFYSFIDIKYGNRLKDIFE